MRFAGTLLLLGLAACNWKGQTHLDGPSTLRDESAYARHEESLAAFQPDVIHWPYVGGIGKKAHLVIRDETGTVPEEIIVEASGSNGEVFGVTVLARYVGDPLNPKGSYSDPVVSDRTRTVLYEGETTRISTFKDVFNTQPRKPIHVEVWFTVISYFRDSGDEINVRVLFDGSEIGSRSFTASDAAPNPDPHYGIKTLREYNPAAEWRILPD